MELAAPALKRTRQAEIDDGKRLKELKCAPMVYPRWATMLLIAGAVLSFVPIPLAGSVLSLAVAWLGFVLFTNEHPAHIQPALATS